MDTLYTKRGRRYEVCGTAETRYGGDLREWAAR